jgi:hypothetical protein
MLLLDGIHPYLDDKLYLSITLRRQPKKVGIKTNQRGQKGYT